MNSFKSSQLPQASFVDSRLKFGLIVVIAATLSASITPSSYATGLVINAGTLSIGSTGILDLQSNNLVVRSGVVGDANGLLGSGITGYVKTGLYNGAGGYWDGPGINSSAAAVESATLNTGVGVIDNALVGYTSWPFNGATGLPQPYAVTLAGSEILVKYTYFGDADLNGIIDITDYGQIDTASGGGGGTGWLNGDFDYSGGVGGDVSDYGLIDTSFGIYTLGGLVLASQGGAPGVQGIPEPSSFVLLAIGAVGFLGRRKTGKH